MVGDILVLTLAGILPALLMLKSDKQVVHLLEGKLFRRGHATTAARKAYSRHKEPVSFILFVGGCWIALAGLVIVGTGEAGIVIAIVGSISALFGVLGRIRSFRAADEELG